jgi:hypothetical protein
MIEHLWITSQVIILVKEDPFTSNNEADSKKHRENNNFTNDYYNFGNMYPSYEPHGKSK